MGQGEYWTKIHYTIVPAFTWGRVPGGGGHRGRTVKSVRKRRALKEVTPEIPFLLLAAFRFTGKSLEDASMRLVSVEMGRLGVGTNRFEDSGEVIKRGSVI